MNTPGVGAQGAFEQETTIWNDIWDKPNHQIRTSGSGVGGGCTFANPSSLIGMTVVNGVATTCLRSDAAHAIDPAIAPVWTGLHSFLSGNFRLRGTTSGTLDLYAPSTGGASVITFPSGVTDFSTTGGTSRFIKQASLGAPFTVVRPTCADLSDAGTGCSSSTGVGTVTSGNINEVPFYNAAGTVIAGSTGVLVDATSILAKREKVTAASTNVSLLVHNIVNITTGASNYTCTLPVASSSTIGQRYECYKADSGAGTVSIAAGNATDNLNGVANVPITVSNKDEGFTATGMTGNSWKVESLLVGGTGAPVTATYVVTTADATLSSEVVVSTIQKGWVSFTAASAKLPTSNPGVIDNSENHTRLLFDAATQECLWWQFIVPPDYGTAPQLRVPYSMLSATSGGVSIDVSIMATTPGDAIDVNTESYATVNNCDDAAVPGTVGFLDVIVCSIVNTDSMAANDLAKVKLCRAPADSADTATGDMEVYGATLEYTKN
jgi:hypothetical protein